MAQWCVLPANPACRIFGRASPHARQIETAPEAEILGLVDSSSVVLPTCRSTLMRALARSDQGPHRALLAVLGVEQNVGAVFASAEIGGVDYEALAPALHLDDDFGDRSIGKAGQAGTDASMFGVDTGHRFDVHETVKGENQVGQVVVGGTQVDRAFQGFRKHWSERASMSVNRCRRTTGPVSAVRCVLNPGADRSDVALFEEGRVRQAQDKAAEVGVALVRPVDGAERREVTALGPASEGQP